MPTNYQVQIALISYLKSLPVILAEVLATEIRENQWQGTEFSYPNIRIKTFRNEPYTVNCDASDVLFAIQIFSQLDSSIEAERIAGIINDALHARNFESNGIRFSTQTRNQVPAIRQDTRTWRSELLMRATATG
jgi:hypothetical protein